MLTTSHWDVLVYYVRAVNAMMLVASSAITADRAAPTETTTEKTPPFLDHVASRPDAILTIRASNTAQAERAAIFRVGRR